MSLAMDRDAVFKCGMSVAPVTDWALYGENVHVCMYWREIDGSFSTPNIVVEKFNKALLCSDRKIRKNFAP